MHLLFPETEGNYFYSGLSQSVISYAFVIQDTKYIIIQTLKHCQQRELLYLLFHRGNFQHSEYVHT